MHAPAAHARSRLRRWHLALATVVALSAAGAGTAIALQTRNSASVSSARVHSGSKGGSDTPPQPVPTAGATGFRVVSTTPQAGSTDVSSNATVSVRFSSALTPGGPKPTLDPPVAGHWKRTSPTTLIFDASAPLVPSTTESLTVPGGTSGMQDRAGQHLGDKVTVTFTVADGSTHRLQELLAQLGYLPMAYVPPNPPGPPQDLAEPQPGPLTWRWQTPSSLTSLWTTGTPNVITKGAIMSFERQNDLAVDGVAGPQVWKILLADVVAGKGDATPYTYVYVSKTLPETLTLYVNGAVKYGGILVNTGAPGATTLDGTYPVFEHVVASDMKGTNITGSTYNDPTVPWASYFDGGDALHGFVRAQYGYPQSNGCVEMPISDAAMVWPYTPIGTLVTVVGLPNTPPVTPSTTTTTTTTTTTPVPSPAPTPTTTTTTTSPTSTTTTTSPTSTTTTTSAASG